MGCVHLQSILDSNTHEIFPKSDQYDSRSQGVVSVHLPTKLEMPTDRSPTYMPGQQFTSKMVDTEEYEGQQRKQEQTTNNEQIKKKTFEMRNTDFQQK